MKNLTTTLYLTLFVLLGSVGVSLALPVCEGSPLTISDYKEVTSWSNCGFDHKAGFGSFMLYVLQFALVCWGYAFFLISV
tara:strand:+ start:129 stop:368 length:240 start_codon:yes stop_codon:yes gene_type:complete